MSQIAQVDARTKITTMRLYNVRRKEVVQVPVDPQFNAGGGIGHYLSKTDTLSGKPLFLHPEAVSNWTDEMKEAARDFTPSVELAASRREKELLEMIEHGSESFVHRLADVLSRNKPAPAPAPSQGKR